MLDYDQVMKVAQVLGYDPRKPAELDEYIRIISRMDSWDITRILFFPEENGEMEEQKEEVQKYNRSQSGEYPSQTPRNKL
ncbi:MAG: hypothetical protein LLG97_00310 [Deltaproteobacteria bacterium]|nr:hypothetical protein [Deltaproteobacteria bacterium]